MAPKANGPAAGPPPTLRTEDKFMKGVSISVWQNSSDDNTSNWTNFMRSKFPFKNFGVKRYRGKYPIDNNPNFWDRYKEDIINTHKLGCNSFRMSIEWARIEPRQGFIDQDAVQRYNDMLTLMEEYNIECMATLHHFTHPQWFEDLGAFEEESNIEYFVKWAETAVKLFGKRIRLWGTFNEPTCAMFLGWIAGMHSPGKIMQFITAGRVLINKLKAHVAAYDAIKASPGGSNLLVGLVHHHITFLALGDGVLHGLAKYMASWMQYWWGYDVVHEWMMTGRLQWHVPIFGKWLSWQYPKGRPPCDWWGINYYSRAVLNWMLQPSVMQSEIMTDMFYPIYGEGLYKSIKQSAQYGLPMYITETGIADKDDRHRSVMINQYMQQILRAIHEGYDVRGLYYWTLVDNFEWNFGYLMKFGLYAWDPEPNGRDRVLREGSKTLVRYYKTLPDSMSEVRKVAGSIPFADEHTYEAAVKASVDEVQEQAEDEHTVLLTPAPV